MQEHTFSGLLLLFHSFILLLTVHLLANKKLLQLRPEVSQACLDTVDLGNSIYMYIYIMYNVYYNNIDIVTVHIINIHIYTLYVYTSIGQEVNDQSSCSSISTNMLVYM